MCDYGIHNLALQLNIPSNFTCFLRWKGLEFLPLPISPPLPSSNAPNPVESREAPPTSSFPGLSEPPWEAPWGHLHKSREPRVSFLTQGSNPGLQHCGQILYWAIREAPRILLWVAPNRCHQIGGSKPAPQLAHTIFITSMEESGPATMLSYQEVWI